MVILYLDAIALRVRLAQKVLSVPVLVALGVRTDGQKVVLDLEALTSESTTAWSGMNGGELDRARPSSTTALRDRREPGAAAPRSRRAGRA